MYNLIESKGDFIVNLPYIQDSPVLYIDTETTGLDVFTSRLLSLQIGCGDKVFILNLTKLSKDLIVYLLQLINGDNKKCIGHSVKFDLKFLYQNYGIMLTNVQDTMITEVLLHQGVGEQYYSLAQLVINYCNKILDKDVRSTFENANDGEVNFTEQQLIYMAEDVSYLQTIFEEQNKKISEQGQKDVLDLENSLIPVVASMEISGIRLNKDKWLSLVEENKVSRDKSKSDILDFIVDSIDFSKFSNAYEASIAFKIPVGTKSLIANLSSLTGEELTKQFVLDNFKVTSHAQIKKVFELLGDNVESTNEKYLREYFKNSTDRGKKLIFLLQKFRELEKKISTYGENFFDVINDITSKAHFEFNQVGTATGRFSASRIHQVPKLNVYREPFESDTGWKIITADYSQAELRLLGEISEETKIIDACINNIDLHSVTASILFNKPVSEVKPEERQVGKTLNFAVVYGTTEYGLAFNFDVSIDVARDYLAKFFQGYNKLGTFIKLAGDKIWEKKLSLTPLGRKRFWESKIMFKDSYDAEKYVSRVKREGINHIIQGGSADITKIAMCNMYYNNPFGDAFKILMQVHDEIVCTAKDEIVDKARDFVYNCMIEAESVFLKKTPCAVDVHVNNFWSK